MVYEDKRMINETAHSLILEGRSRLTVSGVTDVGSFDDTSITTCTTKGDLIVRGEDLHLEKLSLDSGEVIIEGNIVSLEYEDDGYRHSEGFFSRLFS